MGKLFLIGFMGSGKSTVGETLSEIMEFQVVDTDQMIVEKYNQSIKDIFRIEGESAFRRYETEILSELPEENCIVSTGGGIVEDSTNIDLMKESGTIIYLETSFEEIARRLQNDTTRPLWNKGKDKKLLYQKRVSMYKKCAGVSIRTDHKTEHEIACEILAALDIQP